MRKVKPKKCANCEKEFTPTHSTTQKVCSVTCALEWNKKHPPKNYTNDVKKRATRAEKEATMTHSEWLNLLQKVFNTYIRMRDKDKPCISCGCKLVGKFDAGHFYSVKPYYGLRFHENNIFGQCVQCNQHKHGNLIEYAIRLPQRIGQERFKWLQDNRHITIKYSIPEIKELIKEYKEKTKMLLTSIDKVNTIR